MFILDLYLQDTGITSVRIITISVVWPTATHCQLLDFLYTYSLLKTNEISFNTHFLVIAYYVQINPSGQSKF